MAPGLRREGDVISVVMAGLGPAIHETLPWIPGTSPGMTVLGGVYSAAARGASTNCDR